MSAATDKDRHRQNLQQIVAPRIRPPSPSSASVDDSAGGAAAAASYDLRILDPMFYNRYSRLDLDIYPIRLNPTGGGSPSNNPLGGASNSASRNDLALEHHNVHRCRHADWEHCEERRVLELEEAKTRATQMEKTMKWWAECTANWREKWSNVRDERNRCRDESRRLRALCDQQVQSLQKSQAETYQLSQELQDLQRSFDRLVQDRAGSAHGEFVPRTLDDNRVVRDISTQCYIADKPLHQLLQTVRREVACNTDVAVQQQQKAKGGHATKLGHDQSNAAAVNVLKTKLEEAGKTIKSEQEESANLKEKNQQMQHELHMLRAKCEELEASRQAALDELQDIRLTRSEYTELDKSVILESQKMIEDHGLGSNFANPTDNQVHFDYSLVETKKDEQVSRPKDDDVIKADTAVEIADVQVECQEVLDAELEKEVSSLCHKMQYPKFCE